MQTLKGSRLFELLAVLVTVLAVAIAIAFVFTAAEVTRTITTVSSDPLRDLDLRGLPGKPETGIAAKLARGERVTILLLGYGGAGHDGAYLTDSVMVASIEPRGGVVTLLSIPRDLWVRLPKSKYGPSFRAKINAAFAVGAATGDRDEGIRVADETVTGVLGIEVDRTVAVDFHAFRAVVDAIGGIDITVDTSFVAAYPRNDDPDIDATWMIVSFERGPQHMGGETALRFARARYSDGSEGSDFARAIRQQKIVLAAKNKVAGVSSLPQLLSVLAALREDVRTDLSVADLQTLAEFARSYDDSRTIRASLSPLNVLRSGYSAETGYVLMPRVAGWGEVHAYVRRVVEHPNSFAEAPNVVVSVSSARAAVGEAARRGLQALGFDARVELHPGTDPDRTAVVDDGSAVESAEFLSDYFLASLVREPAASGALQVRLGSDWVPPQELQAPLAATQP